MIFESLPYRFTTKYSELNNVVFLELRRRINLFPTLRTLRLCVNLMTKSRKGAKDRKEKNTTLYIDYYLIPELLKIKINREDISNFSIRLHLLEIHYLVI